MFTPDNTEGFTPAELDLLNKALAARMERGEDEKTASDAINNGYCPGIDFGDLVWWGAHPDDFRSAPSQDFAQPVDPEPPLPSRFRGEVE